MSFPPCRRISQNIPPDTIQFLLITNDMIMESRLPGKIGFDDTNPFGTYRFELIHDGTDGTGRRTFQ